MKTAHWLDHLPSWLAWGAVASTGAYSPWELAIMAAPLLWAALAEYREWSLQRWRLLVELTALAGFLLELVARTGLLPTVVTTLFLLCGARLCLPRELPQRRQVLLMGFLIFLTTAISTSDLDFLLWALAWVAGAATVMLQHSWSHVGLRRHRHGQAPPFRLVLPWTLMVLVLATGFFVILPRLRVGFHARGGADRKGQSTSGLSDFLDLAGTGPIEPSREVVLRMLPAQDHPREALQAFAREVGLLRCFALEDLQGGRWSISPLTPTLADVHWNRPPRYRPVAADWFVAPSASGVIPIPYGECDLEPGAGDELRSGRGGGLRFARPIRQTTALHVALTPAPVEREAAPAGTRLALLLNHGPDCASALGWSLRTAPGDQPPQELAQRLSAALRTFRYTLDNPSGAAVNPVADFLDHSHAGHCEYFASALGLMLRLRGVPSRVVNGYRLGPWISGGNYFLVTQGETHSWVEYYDARVEAWRVADPTPAVPPSPLEAPGLAGTLARWSDALKFQWDRHVVRFSDQDQVAGVDWIQGQAKALGHWHPRLPERRQVLLAAAVLLAWGLIRFRGPWRSAPAGVGALPELAPLLRRARKLLPPKEGETARAWLERLAAARPGRRAALEDLAREADAVAYGGAPPVNLKRLARAEARAWTDDKSRYGA